MAGFLWKGILIGLLFGLPAGAVGAMTVQRAWSLGFPAGMLTGLGSSVADCLYAAVGAFGLTLISDYLTRHQLTINLLGGGLILFMGIQLLLKKQNAVSARTKAIGGAKIFLSSFAIGITNPAAVLTFLFAFSYFGISGAAGLWDGIGLTGGVFIGTYLWWWALSAMTCLIKKKTGGCGFPYLNQIFGTILTLFASSVFLKTIL